MSERKKIYPQEKTYSEFVSLVANSRDLHLVDKIKILEYMADECCCIDNNLLYLECKQAVKELHASNNPNH